MTGPVNDHSSAVAMLLPESQDKPYLPCIVPEVVQRDEELCFAWLFGVHLSHFSLR